MKTYYPLNMYFQPIGAANYTVTLTAPHGRNASGVFSLPTAQPEFIHMVELLQRGAAGFDDLRRFGILLFNSLFQDGLRQAFSEARQNLGAQEALRLCLHMDIDSAAELAKIPWEYLFAPEDKVPLAIRDMPIVRCISRSDTLAPALETPLRVLLTTASAVPPKLDSQRELQLIQQILTRLGDHAQVTIETALSMADLERYLHEDYQIWHFVGHGRRTRSGESCLLFQDKMGDIEEVGALALVSLLSASNLKLVVLDACDSGTIAPDVIWNIAPTLVREAVPTVVAMQLPIAEEAARAFAAGFYNGLANGQLVETSVNTGRRAMVVRTQSLRPEWGIPVVYTRSTWQTHLLPADPVVSLFDTLRRLLDDPQHGRALSGLLGSRSTLRHVRNQINELTQCKTAHDILHALHDQYVLLVHDQKRLGTDSHAWLDLLRNEAELYTTTAQLVQHVSSSPALSSRVRRISSLTLARADLRQAILQREQQQLASAMQPFRSVLEIEPDRINMMLVELARVLPLGQLAEELNQFGVRSKAIGQTSQNDRTLALFQNGLKELNYLSAELSSLVECHNKFQDLELELRPVELVLDLDIEQFAHELATIWIKYLRAMSISLIDIQRSWGDTLRIQIDALDQVFHSTESYPIVTAFIQYRALIDQFFSRTDEDILAICRRLTAIGHEIDLVLELITQ